MKLNRHLVFTAIAGLAVAAMAGYLIYRTNEAVQPDAQPNISSGPVSSNIPGEWRLVVQESGGCNMGGPRCATATFEKDGTYTTVWSDGMQASTGMLDGDQLNKLYEASLTATDMNEVVGTCSSFVDGIDYEITLTNDDTVQTQSTCYQNALKPGEYRQNYSSQLLQAYQDVSAHLVTSPFTNAIPERL